jgi:aminoglycoside phosphotransferase (APT) family kinase protein
VEWFERELAAYRALARTQLGVVPRLLGRWQDPGIYPFPFAAVTRLRGEVPAEPGALIGQLGEVIAYWHELAPVLVHGDIHQGQLLADGGRPTGILDWETARVDHPFWDLDLGQWGSGLWRRRDFSALWARGWRAYAQARGLDVGSGPLETAFRLRHALGLLADPGDPAITGTIDVHLAQL